MPSEADRPGAAYLGASLGSFSDGKIDRVARGTLACRIADLAMRK
jgi:hypothetical protein